MKKEIAKLLVEKSEEHWNWGQRSYFDEGDELRLHKSYSGRGMYGSSTCGVSGDEGMFNACVRECIMDMIENGDKDYLSDIAKEVGEFMDATLGATTDSLGMGVIWY